mmetsp:Transcript_15527/g.46057  ORF Transcript_15527/g.46057 Transcript_15527/m.46057 type:complete len:243 (-) Transcript_15527:13-741(-)
MLVRHLAGGLPRDMRRLGPVCGPDVQGGPGLLDGRVLQDVRYPPGPPSAVRVLLFPPGLPGDLRKPRQVRPSERRPRDLLDRGVLPGQLPAARPGPVPVLRLAGGLPGGVRGEWHVRAPRGFFGALLDVRVLRHVSSLYRRVDAAERGSGFGAGPRNAGAGGLVVARRRPRPWPRSRWCWRRRPRGRGLGGRRSRPRRGHAARCPRPTRALAVGRRRGHRGQPADAHAAGRDLSPWVAGAQD